MKFILNERLIDTDLPAGTVALDFIRKDMKLSGTKESCREGECGVCSVLLGTFRDGVVEYRAVASCLLPLGELDGKHLVTIEGLNLEGLSPVQDAIVEKGATQCGFCTPGFVVSLTGFLISSPDIDYESAIDALDGNICRCTGYVSIRDAAKAIVKLFKHRLSDRSKRVSELVKFGALPPYFIEIPNRLKEIHTDTKPIVMHKDGAIIVAGGTDLYVQRPFELETAELEFVSQRNVSDIHEKDGEIIVGAGVTVEDMKKSPIMKDYFPDIRQMLNRVSSTIMRNRATVGGNIVNASPIGGMSIFFLALDALLVITNGKDKRTVPLREFFKGYKKIDMHQSELIESVKFPVRQKFGFSFEKVSQRKYLDIASCNSAMSVVCKNGVIDEIHISAGGVAPVPLYLDNVSRFLEGREISADSVKEAWNIAREEISPISDIRGSEGYKRLLLRQLVFAHFINLFPQKIKFQELIEGGEI
jgi:xanthine dehydrogenase small subunit